MAQYKVPQDVEADDKLIGPFSFRQFVYLLIAGGLIALAVALFQLFPLLAIIPIPFVLLLLALALPLKKDQPMETYLAALVSFYLKPRKRIWEPGQREATILITAPKKVEDKRTRDLSQEEATHRLSFLADIVDTEGYAIKGASKNSMREDLIAEANATTDMFDAYNSNLNRAINEDRTERHNDAVREMREAINRSEQVGDGAAIVGASGTVIQPTGALADGDTSAVSGQQIPEANAKPDVVPDVSVVGAAVETVAAGAEKPAMTTEKAEPVSLSGITSDTIVKPDLVTEQMSDESAPVQKKSETPPKAQPKMVELANNSEFTIATIAKQANRIKRKEDGEVFISLH